MNPNTPFSSRLGMSTPDSRNMDTLHRQAKGLRKRLSDAKLSVEQAEYVEHVASNLERIAEDYWETYQAMFKARTALISVQEITLGVVGPNDAPEPEPDAN